MTKITRKDVLLTPKIIYENLLSMEEKFDEHFDNRTSNLNNNNSKIENQNGSIDVKESSTKYPILLKKGRRAKSELSNDIHVKLLLMAFDAYAETFHLKEIASLSRKTNAQNESSLKELYEREMAKEPSLKAFGEKEMKKFVKDTSFEDRLNEQHSRKLYGFEAHYESIRMYEAVSIKAIDLTKKYCKDFKFFDLIVIDSKKTLPKLRAKFEHLFTQN